jgi:hypothetical protein
MMKVTQANRTTPPLHVRRCPLCRLAIGNERNTHAECEQRYLEGMQARLRDMQRTEMTNRKG